MEKLTHQEEEIMLIIWQVKSGVIKDFLNRMEEPKPPYTTVASIVKNLEKKGFLTSKKHGNIYEYIPVMDESEYKTKFMSGVVRILVKDEVTGKEVLRYGGDFDDKPSDYEFSGNGIVLIRSALIAEFCTD